MTRTFSIITLGCKVNAYESQAIREQLLEDGYREVDSDIADLVIINTCAVTAEAERKDRQVVRRVARLNPNSEIIVMGCSSQIHKEDYLSIEHVKAVLGTYERRRAIRQDIRDDEVNPDSRHFPYEDLSIRRGEHEVRAYIKIQDGCDNFCSYCIVPFARGESRCRDKESIIAEVRDLLSSGVREIVVGGVDTGCYVDPHDPTYDLVSLLEDLCRSSEERYRIRLSSIEASQIDERILNIFATEKRICPHLHIPLQSGSPKILRLMNRKYSSADFKEKISLIRSRIPDVALSTDVITGFPGETEEDFQMTYDFLKSNRFMRIHAFPYSERPGTRASTLDGRVDIRTRQDRVRRLIALSDENEREYRDGLLGREVEVLIEERKDDNIYSGYSENYLNMEITSDSDIIGDFVKVPVN